MSTGPIEWISITMIGLFVSIINIVMIKKELQKRKSRKVIFTSKMSQIASLSCIIFGALFGFSVFVNYFNGFCHFASQTLWLCFYSQFGCMGFYQLSIIYYCFSQTKVYSNKGYPNWVFIIMYIIGILFFFNAIIYPWFVIKIPIVCGINKHYQFVAKFSDDVYHSSLSIWGSLTAFIYVLWDLVTLLMYIIKAISFRKFKSDQIDVYNRIMSILNRILILTILYEIMWIICFFIVATIIRGDGGIISHILNVMIAGISPITVSYSMYLMQQHNTSEYKLFLRILTKTKLHYICCCCFKSIIYNEIEMHSEENRLSKQVEDKNEEECKNKDDTIWETADHSIKNEHSNVKELSIETTAHKKSLSD